MKFAIVANPHKYEIKSAMQATIAWAKDKDVELYLFSEVFNSVGLSGCGKLVLTESDEESIAQSDVVLVMGGDGTILYTARISKRENKPILGINSGRLGFMTNTQIEEVTDALDQVLAGNYELDVRHYIRALDKEGVKHYALNEFLFTRRDTTSMVNIKAEYDGHLISTYWADGLLVASPTGSTAYNLATGGPIVTPGSNVVVVTPINPHTLTTRPLILRADKPLVVTLEQQPADILFSYDGQVQEITEFPFSVEIMKSKLSFQLIQLPGQNYFETLRKKLMWGQDNRRIKN